MLNRQESPVLQSPGHVTMPKARICTLDNGIKVYVLNSGNNPAILKLEILYRAGSLWQNKTLQAGYTAKMLFEGTAKRTARQIAEEFDYLGAYTDNDHSADYSGVTLHVLTRYFDKALALLKEVIEEASFPENQLDVHLQIGKQRLAVKRKKTSYLGAACFGQRMFGDHPYGREVTENDYDLLHTSDLITFHKEFFLNGGIDIVLCGEVGDAEIKLLNQFFGQSPVGHIRSFQRDGEIPVLMPGSDFVNKPDAMQATVILGQRTINRHDANFRELLLLNLILGGYFGSRLMKNIREDKGYTYGIYSRVNPMQEASYWSVQTDVRNDVYNKTVEEIVKEVRRLQEEPIGEDELMIARNYVVGSFMRSLDGDFAVSDRIRQMIVYNMEYPYYDAYAETMLAATPEKLMQLAQEYLSIDKMTTVIAGKRLP